MVSGKTYDVWFIGKRVNVCVFSWQFGYFSQKYKLQIHNIQCVPSLEFGTLYPLKVMNALHYIEDQCISCLLLAILIQYSYSGADYSSNGITEPITQPAVSQDQDQKSKTSELSTTTSSPTISQSSITPTTPVKMNSKSKTSFMEKVSQRASALNMTRLSSELVLATGSSTLRYYQCLQLTYFMAGNLSKIIKDMIWISRLNF